MSLTSPVPDESGIAHTALGHECLYCGGRVTDPAIHWMGHGGEIYLHPDPCLFALFVRLCRDRHELDAPDYYARIRR